VGEGNRNGADRNRELMDDEELIAAVAGGDEKALRALFDCHVEWLGVRLRRLLPAEAVEDVLQETFIAVWQGARRYRPQGRAGGWLWGIAVRQAALWLRRNRRSGEHEWPAVELPGDDDTEAAALARVDRARALARLGPVGSPRRELWRLLFVEDRSEADVAKRLGISQGTVKSRAHRMRQALRAALDREGT
jgi:RNA polymerase sigma-70 factor (ECF subfamily)